MLSILDSYYLIKDVWGNPRLVKEVRQLTYITILITQLKYLPLILILDV